MINCQELRPEARRSSFVKQPLAGTGVPAFCRQQLFTSPKAPARPLTADRVVSLPCSPLGLPLPGETRGRSPAVPLLTDWDEMHVGATPSESLFTARCRPLPPSSAQLSSAVTLRCAVRQRDERVCAPSLRGTAGSVPSPFRRRWPERGRAFAPAAPLLGAPAGSRVPGSRRHPFPTLRVAPAPWARPSGRSGQGLGGDSGRAGASEQTREHRPRGRY